MAPPPRATGLARTPGIDPHHRHRLGVMGGTFDPIHHGHLVAASEVATRFHLDEVVFVPTGQPWQKVDRHVSAAEDRYLMTVIAIPPSNPRFTVSRVDIDRPGMTYTVDTLRDLHAERGDDVDLQLHHRRGRIGPDPDLARRGQALRPGPLRRLHPARRTDPASPAIAELPQDRVTLMEIPALAISSTACRRRVGTRDPIWYLVPDGIVQYIAKRGLYQS